MVVVALGRAKNTGKGSLLHSKSILSEMANASDLQWACSTYQLHASVLTKVAGYLLSVTTEHGQQPKPPQDLG